MSWDGSSAADVYFGTRIVAVCRADEPIVVSGVGSLAAATNELRRWVTEQPLLPKLRLWLSGGLCRPFIVPRIANSSAGELQKIATSLVATQIGWTERVAVRVDKGGREGETVAVAIQASALDEIKRALGPGGARAVSIRPWWAHVLRVSLSSNPQADCLAVHDCDSVCVLAGQSRSIVNASVISPIEDRAAAQAAIARLRFTQGIGSHPAHARLRLTPNDERDKNEGGTSAFDHLLEWVE